MARAEVVGREGEWFFGETKGITDMHLTITSSPSKHSSHAGLTGWVINGIGTQPTVSQQSSKYPEAQARQ